MSLRIKKYVSAKLFGLICVLIVVCPNFGSSQNIIKESIDEKYSQYSASYGHTDVIFREDRIELFYLDENNLEKSDYIVFANASTQSIESGNVLDTYYSPLENDAMRKVLSASSMKKEELGYIVYRDLYPGTDLIVSVVDEGLEFNYKSKSLKEIDSTGLLFQGPKIKMLKSGKEIHIDRSGINNTIYIESMAGFKMKSNSNSAFDLDLNTSSTFRLIIQ